MIKRGVFLKSQFIILKFYIKIMYSYLKSKLNIILLVVIIFFAGVGYNKLFLNNIRPLTADVLKLDEQEATIRAIKKVMPTVVSILVYDEKEITVYNLDTGKQSVKKDKAKQGSGTGFIISSDGLILTNKHVVEVTKEASVEYKIVLSDKKEYDAKLIGKDPINDLAVLKISEKNLPFVELSDSDKLNVGASVIAIGNILGRYQNSVTKGIVSGLERNLTASDKSGNSENLFNIIQTDAEINLGNSGGPLIDLNGKVVGINVAIDQEGSSIGFAIPANDAKPVIRSVKETGRIVRPRLGIRYVTISSALAEKEKLPRKTGALISKGDDGSPAVMAGSPAEKSGLMQGDIVFEINGIKVDEKNTILSIVQKYKPKDKLGLKIQRDNKIIMKTVELDEFR